MTLLAKKICSTVVQFDTQGKSNKHSDETNSDSLMVADECSNSCPPALMAFVGNVSQDQIDAEREAHIASCAYLMESAYADYEASGCLSDRGTADRWRVLRDEAVKARSPEQVRRVEVERGLAWN